MFAGCRVSVGGCAACSAPTVGQSFGGGGIFLPYCQLGLCAQGGARSFWLAARMFVLSGVVYVTSLRIVVSLHG